MEFQWLKNWRLQSLQRFQTHSKNRDQTFQILETLGRIFQGLETHMLRPSFHTEQAPQPCGATSLFSFRSINAKSHDVKESKRGLDAQ